MSFTSLPPIDQSLLPADVRTASPARRDAYTAALGFEQQLVQQLASSLSESAQSSFGDDASPYASMLPNALTQSIMDGGGLGLARQLASAIDPTDTPAPPSTAGAAGGSAAA
jgi:Rod binding domain-containing protein